MAKKSPAIGIDLGTTYSCVAVWQHGKTEIIANANGKRTTPSYVGFTETERLIGDAAKNKAAVNSNNTIFDAKRLIGNKFEDTNVQEHMKHWPFKVVEVEGGKPRYEVKFKGQVKRFAPEEISSMVLANMKETAEAYLGSEVTDAVITVPAYFNDSQRQATKDAGTIAGLNVLRIINEPTAAALAYGLDKKVEGKKNVLVFDLGGGTFDVSILSIDQGSFFEVKSTAGDNHLGGEDFDNRLASYCMEQFKRNHKKDISSNPRAMRRLRTACEEAKRNLSSSAEANIVVESLHAGIDFDTVISRARFQELCFDLFEKTLDSVQAALSDSNICKTDIDEVVLVGGSTRIPKIQQLLQDFFNGKELNKTINPDEAVAHGAAILAATLSGHSTEEVPIVSLVDVIPFSLGIAIIGGQMSIIMKRNTIIPSKRSEVFTDLDNQTSVGVYVYEGERPLTKDNRFLGLFKLNGISPAPAGKPKFDVTFEIDVNGILSVTARDESTGNQDGITIKSENGRLSPQELDRMILDAWKYKAEDMEQIANGVARNQLEDFIFGVKQASDNASAIDPGDFWKSYKDIVSKKHLEVLHWLDTNRLANKEESENMLREVRKELLPVILKLKQSNEEVGYQNPAEEMSTAFIKTTKEEQLANLKKLVAFGEPCKKKHRKK